MKLEDIGWDSTWQFQFDELPHDDLAPARIVRQDRGRYLAFAESGEVTALLPGRLRHEGDRSSDLPAVGDWVGLRTGSGTSLIDVVLPRKSAFARQAAGTRTEPQVLAANIDWVFIVTGLDGDFNPRRIERYLTLVWEGGASPVVVLNKSDLSAEPGAAVDRVRSIAGLAEVRAVSALTGVGVTALQTYFEGRRTVAFLGSSGSGKSTLTNRLLGRSRQETGAVREDDSRGRHTTVRRELIGLEGGGAIIDTPGLREVQLWADEHALEESFGDISMLAGNCRFADCRHAGEPGCAVREALESGVLEADRFSNFVRMQREIASSELRRSEHELRAEQRRFTKMVRRMQKDRGC